MKEFKLPPRFYTDHRSRDCGETGVIVRELRGHIVARLDTEALKDLIDDAVYYSDSRQFDFETRGICLSAQATLKALARQGVEL